MHPDFSSPRALNRENWNKCVEKLKSIPIIHLHGDLGELPYFETDAMRPYTEKLSEYTMRVATQRIKIIHEGFDNAPQFAQAQKILSDSSVISFLGFGYHPLNMGRLGFKRGANSRYPYLGKIINGTTLGLTNAECQQIGNRHGLGLRNASRDLGNLDVLQFLREMGTLHGN